MKYTEQYWNDVRKSINSIPEVQSLFGKNILVTGANGMICSSVIDILLLLNKEYHAGITILAAGRSEARMTTRFPGLGEDDGFRFVYYDATSQDGVDLDNQVDYIIHGASNANPAIYMKEPVDTILANIIGLNAMLNTAKTKGSKRILYISSSEVYGQNSSMEPYKEGDYGYLDILGQRSGYPSSKRTGESLCVAYGMQHGTDTVIVRPGHIYGPTITKTDNRATAQFARNGVVGENIVMKSKGEQKRSYCYTLDCASAILAVLIKGEKDNAYNISNPHSICTIREIAEEIARASNVEIVFECATEAENKSYNTMQNSSLDSTKLESLGWIPAFSLQEGVASMMKTMKAEVQG